MAYNFEEVYSTDSFVDSNWESICRHVGVSFKNEECDVENITRGSQSKGKERKSPKAEKDNGPENEISRGNPENTGTGEIKSEISETDELCIEMKNMRKILKRGRSVLLNPDIEI